MCPAWCSTEAHGAGLGVSGWAYSKLMQREEASTRRQLVVGAGLIPGARVAMHYRPTGGSLCHPVCAASAFSAYCAGNLYLSTSMQPEWLRTTP